MHVHNYELANEVLRRLRDFLPHFILKIILATLYGFKQLVLIIVPEWHLSRKEDVGDHAAAPHVALVIMLSLNDFGRHVDSSPHELLMDEVRILEFL